MTLVELKVELTRTNHYLERIAVALERLAGPAPTEQRQRRIEAGDVIQLTDEELWAMEMEQERQAAQGGPPESEPASARKRPVSANDKPTGTATAD